MTNKETQEGKKLESFAAAVVFFGERAVGHPISTAEANKQAEAVKQQAKTQ